MQNPEQLPLLGRNILLLLQSLNIKFDPNVIPVVLEYIHRWITTLLLDSYQISTENRITAENVKQIITSRVQWEFIPVPSRTMFAKLADQLNVKPLPTIKEVSGLRLPDDNDCLVYSSFKTVPVQQVNLQNPYQETEDMDTGADDMGHDAVQNAPLPARTDIRDEDDDYD
eukprot:NODE_22_length_42145_cov_1.310612.p29 type:complete len:170 gc:universal NODE_22_length_42145_cov_1.310612:18404-17895(-)